MRIPHYLIKAPSGMYHFRRRMPVLLQAMLGRPIVKRSLQTRDVAVARDRALALWRAYDELHRHVRMGCLAGMTKETKLLLEQLKKQGTHYRLVTRPDGTIEVEANGPGDHALAREMVESIGDMRKEAIVQAWMREQTFSPGHPAAGSARPPRACTRPASGHNSTHARTRTRHTPGG